MFNFPFTSFYHTSQTESGALYFITALIEYSFSCLAELFSNRYVALFLWIPIVFFLLLFVVRLVKKIVVL